MICHKVLVVNDKKHYSSYYKPAAHIGDYEADINVLYDNPNSIALVVFTGGEDVSPELYGESKNKATYINPYRDKTEIKAFNRAKDRQIPMLGICRGAQFLCCMAGGKLVQHIDNHSCFHDMKTDDGRLVECLSEHHQMMLPPKDAVVAAWSEPVLSTQYVGEKGKLYNPEKEYEAVYFPSILGLGVQYHPEGMDEKSEGFLYSVELINRFLKPLIDERKRTIYEAI